MKYRLLVVAIAVVISVFFLNIVTINSFASDNENTGVKFDVHVFDVDLSRDVAEVNITITISNLSFTPLQPDENVTAIISNDIESVQINCKKDAELSYSGCSGAITWTLTGNIGKGEYFPFEQYELVFRLANILFATRDPYNMSDVKMDSQNSFGRFDGPRKTFLARIFKADNTTYLLPSNPMEDLKFAIYLSRNPGPFSLPTFFWMLIIPILVCYFLLSSTLGLHRKKDLGNKLHIYVSLFFFSPTFLMAIQGYVPLRATLSIPEVLLVNLMISTSIFTISSLIRVNPIMGELLKDGVALFVSASVAYVLFLNFMPIYPTSASPVFAIVFLAYFLVASSIWAFRLGKEFGKRVFDTYGLILAGFGILFLVWGLSITPVKLYDLTETTVNGIIGVVGVILLLVVAIRGRKRIKKHIEYVS